ncbi:glycosyl hydrolase [soil metagenome]
MIKRIFTITLLLACLTQLKAQVQWPVVTQSAKPWTRWWWMGSAVDKPNITTQVSTFNKAGFGGVEIVPIYGAIGYEPTYIKYLTPQWMGMLDHSVKQATVNNMGVYISVGTGWPIGGPQVGYEDAATKLITQVYHFKAGESLKELIVVNDPKQKSIAKLIALTAYSDDGTALLLTDKVSEEGVLNWMPEKGNWTLYAAFTGKTLQKVKRAAPGGEGFTLDHFSATSLNNYFKSFDTAFGNTAHGVKAFYNDSYEVYGADWTPSLFDEFLKRRGYDLRLYLRELVGKDSSDIVSRVKSDYRETISDLMLQRFAKTFTTWSHSRKALSLNQAHGSPGNLLDLYGAFDIPEAETFGSSAFDIPGIRRDSGDIRNVNPDPVMLKFASSAAHANGSKLASCETFTWLTEHFKTSWSQCKPEVEQVFLAGINHVFYHGTTYSPEKIAWPGWLFYASVNFVPTNSLWPHLNGLNNYIARCQAVLQSGDADNEILAWWPIQDAWANTHGMDMPFKVHDIDEWLHPTKFYKNVMSLQKMGYAIDFVSDKMLAEAGVNNGLVKVSPKGAAHKILLISASEHMPVATLKSILRLAGEGATVIIQKMPADVPGLNKLQENRAQLIKLIQTLHFADKGNNIKEAITGKGKIILSEDVANALSYAKIEREKLTDEGLKFIRRSVTGGKYYFIVNHTSNMVDKKIELSATGNSAIMYDPLTGVMGKVATEQVNGKIIIRIQLKPGESIIIKLSSGKQVIADWKYKDETGTAIEFTRPWKLHFTKGGPLLPSDKSMNKLQPWTNFTEDENTQSFSGTGVYSTTIKLNAKISRDYLLKLDKVDESARIIINGKDAGICWSVPFEMKIGKYLKPGVNTIAIEVCNLMANRIHYMDQHTIEWRKYHEINFVNINYQNFDASNWKVQPSGLDGNIAIIPLK